MHVFVLPSWYPSRRQPMAGLFARDQARAVARARPDWRVVVGTWGHHDGALSLRDLAGNLRAMGWRARARAGWHEVGDEGLEGARVHEHLTPRLSWTLALAGGGVRGLLSASRANLQAAEARFGPVDVLHAHVGFPAGWIAAQLKKERNVPVVLTEHMGPFPFPALRAADGGPNAPLREAFAQAQATVAVSQALAQRLRDCKLPCDTVIPNGVDDARFSTLPLPARPEPGQPFVFFALGSLLPVKGFDVLLQALARLPAALNLQIHLGGDGPDRATLHALAQRLGVEGRLRWLGALAPTAVPAALAQSHAFVLSSRHESFGVVAVEALMAGRPVLATRCGGPEDIVREGDGLLVPGDDPDALAAGLQALAEGRVPLDAPAARRDRAVARFGSLAVGRQVAAVLERAARRP